MLTILIIMIDMVIRNTPLKKIEGRGQIKEVDE